jgi:D-psicose/D-tagatose/L-ribulose 3-epimerase
MNMLLWGRDVLGPDWDPVYARLVELGYDGVEIPVYTLDPRPYAALGERLRALGLTPLTMNVRGPQANPIADDPSVRARGRRESLAALACASALGAEFFCGPFVATPSAFTGRPATALERTWALQLLTTVGDAAAQYGITLAMESMNRFQHYLTTTAAETAALCREADRPQCRMLYDTYHAHLEETDVASAIAGCADMLAYVHVSENDRSTPGQGQVAWDATFQALQAIGYDGWLTIEAFGHGDPALAAALRVWRRTYDTEDDVAREGIAFVRDAWSRSAADGQGTGATSAGRIRRAARW